MIYATRLPGAAEARVTVILPTYERAAYLPQSLDSLLGQTIAPAQVLVVNDGSTDDTAKVIASYGDRVTCINKENGGKPSAINAALPLVTGDYIWVFDDDDIACDDALERHLRVLERRPDVGFTYSACYRCHDDPTTGTLVTDRAYPVRPFADDEYYLELLLSSYVAGPAVIVRTSVQREVGEYRADMIRSEDLEIATRWGLVSIGARLDLPHPTYYRRDHQGARGDARDRFDVQQSAARAREYERKIIRELGQSIELYHYLPRSLWGRPLNREREVRAHLRRWVVHMQKGLWEEAIGYLAQLADMQLDAPDVMADMRVIGLRAMCEKRTLEELAGDPDAMRELSTLLRRRQLRPLRRCLLRQLYYHARVEIRQHDWGALALTIGTAAPLLGRFPLQLRDAAPGRSRP